MNELTLRQVNMTSLVQDYLVTGAVCYNQIS